MQIALLTCTKTNSRRISKKNIREFCGRRLLEYTLQTMQELHIPSYIITADVDHGKIALSYGVQIISEPSQHISDSIPIVEKMLYVHDICNADYYVLLQPTSPIRNKSKIKYWIDIVTKNNIKNGEKLLYLVSVRLTSSSGWVSLP